MISKMYSTNWEKIKYWVKIVVGAKYSKMIAFILEEDKDTD